MGPLRGSFPFPFRVFIEALTVVVVSENSSAVLVMSRLGDNEAERSFVSNSRKGYYQQLLTPCLSILERY